MKIVNYAPSPSKGVGDHIVFGANPVVVEHQRSFLAYLSQRLMGELIVDQSLWCPSSVRLSVCPSVNIFIHLLL